MALASYDDVRGSMIDWFARDDLDSRLDDFILLAESAMQRELDSLDTEVQSTITGVTGVIAYDLPVGFTSIRAVSSVLNGKSFTVEYRSPESFFVEKPRTAQASLIYTIIGRQILFGPEPGEGQEYYVTHFARFTPLSPNNATNWILDNYPDAYLTGCNAEVAGYLKNKEEEAKWITRFSGAIQRIQDHIEKLKYPTPLEIRSA